MEQQFEGAEKILSQQELQELQPGLYNYYGIGRRGTSDDGSPISVITLERNGRKELFYAPPPPVFVSGSEGPAKIAFFNTSC